ncbi:MAG: IS200/IS605 family transposase [Prolixibacteraceae bacterium]|nr:IS200/IS605 family transposase [Prolixibacteraceae bacterium]
MYIHTVFAVKYRKATLKENWRKNVFGVIGNLINETGCKTIIVNGVEDHVHCFLGLKPTLSVSNLLQNIKAKSSKYINDHKLLKARFEWQEGYGVFSYSHSQIDSVYNYIQNQESHHKKESFREEYIALLEKFDVPYDERYIFSELI